MIILRKDGNGEIIEDIIVTGGDDNVGLTFRTTVTIESGDKVLLSIPQNVLKRLLHGLDR